MTLVLSRDLVHCKQDREFRVSPEYFMGCTSNRPWTSLYPTPLPTPHPPTPRILPHDNFWVPWPSKYTVQVVCKWAVAVCVCGAGSNEMHYEHYMEFLIAMTLSLSNSFIMTKTHTPFLFFLNVSLLLGTADAEILRSPLLKTQSRRMFSLKST